MFASEIVADVMKPLQYSMKGEQALLLMHDYLVAQLPVIDDDKFLGMLNMEEILAMPDLDLTLREHFSTLKRVYVLDNAHVLEVMKVAIENNLRVVAVLDSETGKYRGLISAESCLKAFAEMNAVMEDGSVLELDVAAHDYQLSEIIRIAEANEGVVLAAYSTQNVTTGRYLVTLKLKTNDLAAMIAAYERYNYLVKSVINENTYTEDVKERYKALMRFLNV